MRWTIDRQLLYPVLLVVLATTLATSVWTAYWFAWLLQRRDAQRLEQIVATLSAPGFPLTPAVLQKMSGLSGAGFVVLDDTGRVQMTTTELTAADRSALAGWLGKHPAPDAKADELFTSTGRHLVQRVAIREQYPGARPRWLLVLSPAVQTWDNWRAAGFPPAIVGTTSCLVLIGLVAWRARQVVRPLRRLQQQAGRIAVGDFREIELPPGDDEIRELSVSINQMGSQLSRYEQQVRAQERLQTLGTIAGGMAHHLRNAATGGRLAVELHQLECPLAHDDDPLAVAQQQFTLMETYLQRMLLLGRGDMPGAMEPPREVPLAEVIDKVVRLVEPMCRHAQIRLETLLTDAAPTIRANPDALEQMFTNLLINAIDAVKPLPLAQRRVELSVRVCEAESQRERGAAPALELLVRDWGPGPAPAVTARLFELFASDKPDGIGLGLAVVRRLAELQGASVSWRREEPTTCFAVHFPSRLWKVADVQVACR